MKWDKRTDGREISLWHVRRTHKTTVYVVCVRTRFNSPEAAPFYRRAWTYDLLFPESEAVLVGLTTHSTWEKACAGDGDGWREALHG